MTVIRGHYVYMSIWKSTIGESLTKAPEIREEAIQYDKFLIGVYKDVEHKILVGHLLVEVSSLCYHFLGHSKDKKINVVVTGKRHKEVGLVIPAKLSFETYDKTCAGIF